MIKKGQLVISLDFELHWGVFDKINLDQKGKEKFIRTREVVIPKLLELFGQYEVKVTWATVGFLFAKDLKQLHSFWPSTRPDYQNKELNPYALFESGLPGESESENPFHFAHSILKTIQQQKGQEIASHSFSHFYCLEPEINIEAFKADIESAQAIAKENFGIGLKSFVFPRNQFNETFLKVLKDQGFDVVRSNPQHWTWNMDSGANDKLKRLFRLLDAYLVIRKPSGNAVNNNADLYENEGTRFFRPYSNKLKSLERLKMRRIKKEMKACALSGNTYHLWWHPHNFSDNTDENIAQLNELLEYYTYLAGEYGMASTTMANLARN